MIYLIKEVSEYLIDKEFRMNLYSNKLHIVNYNKLISIDDDYISVMNNSNKIVIKGSNLTLIKILDHELLIKGKVNKIEVQDE